METCNKSLVIATLSTVLAMTIFVLGVAGILVYSDNQKRAYKLELLDRNITLY